MAMGRIQPSNSTIVGVAMLLFGSILLGVGIHHLVTTGTCSSTGYSANYGPVPHCPSGTGWWILFLVGGIFLGVFGGLIANSSSAGMIIPAIFTGIGIGSLTVAFDSHAASGAKTFGLIFGGAFAVFGVIPALVMAWSGLGRLRTAPAASPRAAPASGASTSSFGATASPFGPTAEPDAIMGTYASATPGITSPMPQAPRTISPQAPRTILPQAPRTISPLAPAPAAAGGSAGDPLGKIAKLAQLRDQGALTEDEFSREKAKLLAEL